jgi:hypothetical protein
VEPKYLLRVAHAGARNDRANEHNSVAALRRWATDGANKGQGRGGPLKVLQNTKNADIRILVRTNFREVCPVDFVGKHEESDEDGR